MEEWKTYKLGELMDIKGGKRLPKGEMLTTTKNSHPYIRIRDLGATKTLELTSSFEYVDDEVQKHISRYIVNSNDVILSIVGTIGLVAIVGNSLNNANLTENCVKFINLKGIDSNYLYYFLISPLGQDEISKGIVGAVQPKLPIKNIESISIPVPNIDLQQKIASILTSIDAKIELNRKINDNLEQQAQALYKSWFVDFEPFKDGKFIESELGQIPEGWRIYTLNELMDIKRGSSPRPIQSYLSETGLKWLKISDATSCSSPFIYEIQEHIKSEGLRNTGYLQKGALVLSNSATPGLPKILGIDTCIHDGWLYFPISKLSNPFMYLMFIKFRENLISQANGSVFMNLKTEIVKNLKIALPKREIIEQFDLIISSIFNEIRNRTEEMLNLSKQRDTLLPKLMSGEIKINEIDC